MSAQPPILLAGDIGATKTVLALCQGGSHQLLARRSFRNADYATFTTLLQAFFQENTPQPSAACLGVAGPVVADRVHMTNLNWQLDGGVLAARFGLRRVWLINDLVATAVGALHLPESDFLLLNPGVAQQGAVRAVLAPGSGLGEAFLVPQAEGFFPCASEGGHASFAPRNQQQDQLLAFMRKRLGHVSVEQVCSGLAVPQLFAFMGEHWPVPAWLHDEIKQATDATPVILGAAVKAEKGEIDCEVARRSLHLFLDILADEAANLVLKTLAFGGLYLGGGLSARLQSCIDAQRFMAIFARGTYGQRLAQVPIRLIRNPEAALWGAAAHGIELLAKL